jgi:acyl homoserine lactone synthase
MEIVLGSSTQMPPSILADMARYRRKVFVEKLGWELHGTEELEFDQFDRADTLYVVARNRAREVVGTARLLPTLRPYLLGDVFPGLLGGLPAPASADVWELSRFAAMDLSSSATPPSLGQFSAEFSGDLLRAAMRCAAAHGAKRLITVSPLAVERLLRKAGFETQRAGPAQIIDGATIFACWIRIPAQLLPH